MIKTVKNMRPRAHQRCLWWSQELSLRGIKTSPPLLLRWPIKNLFLQCRSCLQPITSTSTSISPASEPAPRPRPPPAPHRAKSAPPQTPAQVAPGSIPYPPPHKSVPANVVLHQYHIKRSFFALFCLVDHCNTKFKRLVCKSLIQNMLIYGSIS